MALLKAFITTGWEVRRVLQKPEEVPEVPLRGLPGRRHGSEPRPHRGTEESQVTTFTRNLRQLTVNSHLLLCP